jgi:hypothetical protein
MLGYRRRRGAKSLVTDYAAPRARPVYPHWDICP